MSSSPPLESLTNSDLRQKLLQYGYDLPTSVNKDFLIKKLNSLMQDKDKDQVKGRKSVTKKTPDRSVPIVAPRTTPASPQPINTRTTRGGSNTNTVLPRANSLSNTFAAGTQSQQCFDEQDDEGPTPNKLVARSRSTGRTTRRSTPYIVTAPSRKSPARNIPIQVADATTDEEEDQDNYQLIVEPPSTRPRISFGHIPKKQTPSPPSEVRTGGFQRSSRVDNNAQSSRFSLPSPSARLPLGRTEAALEARLTRASISTTTFSRSSLSPTVPSTSTSTSATTNDDSKNWLGLIVNGRQMQTDYIPNTTKDPKKFVFNIVNADPVDYIVVFLAGTFQFPSGYGGQVFFGWPDERNEISNWKLLGHISNIRPSAIFNVTELKFPAAVNENTFDFGLPSLTKRQQLTGPTTAQIGVSIEPLGLIESSIRRNIQL